MNGAGNRIKGASFERIIADAFQLAGWPATHRTRTPGTAADLGDLGGLPVVVECKNCRAMDLSGWMRQAEAAGVRANRPAVIIHKRKGVADPSRQWVTMNLRTFLWLMRKAYAHNRPTDASA